MISLKARTKFKFKCNKTFLFQFHILEKTKLQRQDTDLWLPRAGSEEKRDARKEHQGTFGGDRTVLCLRCVDGAYMTYASMKIHSTVH